MATFYADLHVHSKYSRATSRDCDLEHLAFWAARKGISVVGTGDFTHPAWFAEIRENLVPAEPGLFRLRPELEREVGEWLGGAALDVRFMLEVEISTIYKKDDRTRKVHHLVYAPDLEAAERFTASLARIGNVASDGRPILGLDSRHLLEIALASGEGTYLVPAHIWTPWFAVLGSKSGFDTIEHCYGDLAGEIFAVETGLSSDPPMNRRLSKLDRYTLVSNSDAHSPPKLGREACVFDAERDYFAMRDALRTGTGYGGTVEFFPEEGKYHYDGHRKCEVSLDPEATRARGGSCPVCGKPVTLGVMHRVAELADRPAPPEKLPDRAAEFRSLIPLAEVLGEIQGVGPQSKAVARKYDELLARVGPELFLLEHAPPEDLARAGSPLLAEAVARMRSGRVIRQAGFDGQYGTIRLFTPDELRRGTSVGLLFEFPEGAEQPPADKPQPCKPVEPEPTASNPPGPAVLSRERLAMERPTGDGILDQLDPDQRAAAEAVDGPVVIVAGPGTGKTRTLTHRLAHLVADRGVPPEACLAVTFSRRAAGEMRERLGRLLPGVADRVPVMTFHGLGLSILREHGGKLGLAESVRVAGEAERTNMLVETLLVSERKAGRLLAKLSRRKRSALASATEDGAAADADDLPLDVYENELRRRGWVDFDDLLLLPVRLLEGHADVGEHYRGRWRWVSVDEFQDIDAVQYRLLRLLVPPEGNLAVIGDPDQAIYSFRGADVGLFGRFQEDYPGARTVVLGRNYRSTQTIVDAALELIAPASLVGDRRLKAHLPGPEQIEIHTCSTDRAEAELIVHTIERMVGGSTFFSFDSDRVESHEGEGREGESLSFSDFAVLYRTEAQAEPLVEALARSGIPFQRRSHSPLADQPAVQAIVRALGSPDPAPETRSVLGRLESAAEGIDQGGPQLDACLAALRSLAARHGDDLAGFLSELALGVDADLWDPRADRVSLLTLHAAKGLEFPVVFLTGCEDGILPLRFGSGSDADSAEERRLLFVGMTRAQSRLVLTHARRRLWRGKPRELPPSPFLEAIRRELLARHQHRAKKKPKPAHTQQTLF